MSGPNPTPPEQGAAPAPPSFSHGDQQEKADYARIRAFRLKRIAALAMIMDSRLDQVVKALADAEIGELGELHDDLTVDALMNLATATLGAITLFGRHITRRRIRLERRMPLDVATVFAFKRMVSGNFSTTWRTLAHSAQSLADFQLMRSQPSVRTVILTEPVPTDGSAVITIPGETECASAPADPLSSQEGLPKHMDPPLGPPPQINQDQSR